VLYRLFVERAAETKDRNWGGTDHASMILFPVSVSVMYTAELGLRAGIFDISSCHLKDICEIVTDRIYISTPSNKKETPYYQQHEGTIGRG
jgi:hypothetical protein